MKKVLFTAGIVLLAAITASAQTHKKKSKWWEKKHDVAGAFQLQATYRQTDLTQLNNGLNSAGLGSVSNNNIWLNLSMSHIHKKWIFEDGLGFTPFSSSETNNVKTRFNQYQAYFRAGYDISTNADFRFYPFAGLNFSEAVLNIQDNAREQNTSNFSQELLNSTSSKTLYQPNFGIELGAGFDYLIKLKPKKMDCFEVQRNIPIGIRAGYYINAYRGDWRINDYKLNNGPDKNQGAVFVSLNIGLGYVVKK